MASQLLPTPNRPTPPNFSMFADQLINTGLFQNVGLAVAASWLGLALGGRWRRPADWIDATGRVVGIAWILTGLAWSAAIYVDLVWA